MVSFSEMSIIRGYIIGMSQGVSIIERFYYTGCLFLEMVILRSNSVHLGCLLCGNVHLRV